MRGTIVINAIDTIHNTRTIIITLVISIMEIRTIGKAMNLAVQIVTADDGAQLATAVTISIIIVGNFAECLHFF